jgi:hypothetical protein
MRTPNVVDRVESAVCRRKPLGMVDRVERVFREHAAGLADREASVVRLERVVLPKWRTKTGMPTTGVGQEVAGRGSRTVGARETTTTGTERETAGRDDQPRTGFLRKDFIGAYRWMRGLVGANVVKKTVHRRNLGKNRLRTDRQV